MSRGKNKNHAPKAPTMEPPIGLDAPVTASGPDPVQNLPRIDHVKMTADDYNGQDRTIADMESIGYHHYESLRLGGNEILLRFRFG